LFSCPPPPPRKFLYFFCFFFRIILFGGLVAFHLYTQKTHFSQSLFSLPSPGPHIGWAIYPPGTTSFAVTGEAIFTPVAGDRVPRHNCYSVRAHFCSQFSCHSFLCVLLVSRISPLDHSLVEDSRSPNFSPHDSAFYFTPVKHCISR